MVRPFVVSLALFALVATTLAPRWAHAESAPRPQECKIFILPEGKVPANLPAFVVSESGSPGLTSTVILEPSAAIPSPELEAIPDPRAPGVTLFVPKTKAAFELGPVYSVGYTVTCSNPNTVTPPEATWSFVAAAPVALPTRIGAVRELADGRAVITPTAELAAYLSTTRFETFIDGRPVGGSPYGVVRGAELDVALRSADVGIGNLATAGGVVPPVCKGEKHAVRLVAHVAGAETDPEPLDLSLSLFCTTTPASYLPDGGGDDRGAFGGEGGGCAVNGGAPLGRIAMFFGLGAGIAIRLRRRRRG